MDEKPETWLIAIDKRDVLAATGSLLILVGAAAIHWAAALVAAGAALLALSYRLSR